MVLEAQEQAILINREMGKKNKWGSIGEHQVQKQRNKTCTVKGTDTKLIIFLKSSGVIKKTLSKTKAQDDMSQQGIQNT